MRQAIYRAEVRVPDEVYMRVLDGEPRRQFEFAMEDAQRGNIGAGCYDYTNEWAEFHRREDADACERRMRAVIAEFGNAC